MAKFGARRYWLSVDLGQVIDPSAFVLIRDERIPFWDRNRQRLNERQRAIVWADFVKDASYSVIAQYIRTILTRAASRGRVKLAIDATGVGRAYSDFLMEKQIEHAAVTDLRPVLGPPGWRISGGNGAAWVTRTPDPRITNAMLYQLS